MTGKFFKAQRQAGKVVVRDEKQKIVKASPEPAGLSHPDKKVRHQHWRILLRQADITGIDTLLELRNIAMGVPFRAELPDGSHTEWQVADASVRRQALKDLVEFQFGKAVAATEMVRAEKESEDLEAYRAMSDQELLDLARPYLERVEPKSLPDTEAKGEDDPEDS